MALSDIIGRINDEEKKRREGTSSRIWKPTDVASPQEVALAASDEAQGFEKNRQEQEQADAKRKADKKREEDLNVGRKLSDIIEGAVEPVAKLADTAVAAGGGVVDTGKAIFDTLTKGQEEGDKTAQEGQARLDERLKKGVLFNRGTYFNGSEDKALQGDAGEFAKKTVGAGVENGVNFAPPARGFATAVEQGAKPLISALLRVGGEGALLGAAGSAGNQLADKGNVDAGETFKSALTSALLGMGGVGARKFMDRGKSAGPSDFTDALAPSSEGQKLLGPGESRGALPETAGPSRADNLADGSTIVRDTSAATARADRLDEIDSQIDRIRTQGGSAGEARKLMRERDAVLNDMETEPTKAPGQMTLAELEAAATRPVGGKTEKVAALDAEAPAAEFKMALEGEPKAATKTVGEEGDTLMGQMTKELATKFGEDVVPEEALARHMSQRSASGGGKLGDVFGDKFQDAQTVLSRRMGKAGSDIVDRLATASKKSADFNQHFEGIATKVDDALKGVAKTQAGKTEVQRRMQQALSDRANADQYIKNDKERALYDALAEGYDLEKQLRVENGLPVREDYAPWLRTVSPEKVDQQLKDRVESVLQGGKGVTAPDVTAASSKARTAEDLGEDVDPNIAQNFRSHTRALGKELSFKPALDELPTLLEGVPTHLKLNPTEYNKGVGYLKKLLQQTVSPDPRSNADKTVSSALSTTYKNQLRFNPKYAITNIPQRYMSRDYVSKEAYKVIPGKSASPDTFDPADLAELRKGIQFGDNVHVADINATPENTTGKFGKADEFIDKIDPGRRTEKSNIDFSFDRGAAQAIIDSAPYKEAIKNGSSKREAASIALKDPTVKELAIRSGNVTTNVTQFGANFATKPEVFRSASALFKPFLQYQRFPVGMVQHIVQIKNPTNARAMDIMRRGDPRETPLVDYLGSAKALLRSTDDVIKGIKSGEITDVTPEQADGYRKVLSKAIDQLEGDIKKTSKYRAGKSVKTLATMWGAATAIQFLFDGGVGSLGDPEEAGKSIKKAVTYGSPVSVPTLSRNPLQLTPPSSPIKQSDHGPYIDAGTALNFVPGVGLLYNRGEDIAKFVKGLTGGK